VTSETLPPVVAQYLLASAQRDVDAIVACFSDGATVVDEGKHWSGATEIRQWREGVDTAFQYTSSVTGVTDVGDADGAQQLEVYVHLEGDFPGGEVDLVNTFTVRDDHIVDLRIVPAAS
jgi:ketosteroid isomerase-like protein